MYTLLQVFGTTILMITTAQCLSCFTENLFECELKSVVEEGCPYGVTKDICFQCWVCAKGYKEKCGGIWDNGGRCAEGLRCSNSYSSEGFTYAYQSPGICCRNTPLTGRPLALPACTTGAVRNPCTGEYECKKEHGEVCGGDGDIKGVCAENLTCYPRLTGWTRDLNSTCIFQDEIPPTTKDYRFQ